MIEADVVVIGGGSAGCVLAARLSENPARSVVLLEAGPFGAPGLDDATVLPIEAGSPWVRHYDVELTSGRRATVPRGRVLGGSGAVNGGYFARALPRDFAHWPWSYDDVLPYYRKLETDHDFDGPAHGDHGPVPVRRARELTAFDEQFVAACRRAGHADVPDLNAGDVYGVGRVPCNIVDGRRVDTARAYLDPDRANLRVVTGAAAQTLLVDGSCVVGVAVQQRGDDIRIEAGLTVVCAGAIESPALLLRSGIGDPAELSAAGVPVAHPLPGVGTGFADHPEWTVPRPGPDCVAAPLNVVLNTGDIEIRPYTSSFARFIAGNPDTRPRVGVALMHSAARGTVRLRDGRPSISYRYDDVFPTGLDDVLAELGITGEPTLGTSQHMTGTCRMGVVVDERLRVYGLEGLAVADASVIPAPLSRGIHATVVMVAERAADLLV